MSDRARNYAMVLLIAAGCSQFAGYLLDSRELRGLGIAYALAPLPTVFSTVEGVEGFDTIIEFVYPFGSNSTRRIFLDAIHFDRFEGHFFLKNGYSILLAYPHVFEPAAYGAAMRFAICDGDLIRRLHLDSTVVPTGIRIESVYRTANGRHTQYPQPAGRVWSSQCHESASEHIGR